MGRKESPTKRAKAKAMLELKLMGVPNTTIASQFGISSRYVTEMQLWGKKQGLIDEISDRLTSESLPKIAQAFNQILDTDIADATLNSKGYSIKVKAAEILGKGLGVLKAHKASTMAVKGTMDLEQYHQMRKMKAELDAPPLQIEEIKD